MQHISHKHVLLYNLFLVVPEILVKYILRRIFVEVVLSISPLNDNGSPSQFHKPLPVQPGLHNPFEIVHLFQILPVFDVLPVPIQIFLQNISTLLPHLPMSIVTSNTDPLPLLDPCVEPMHISLKSILLFSSQPHPHLLHYHIFHCVYNRIFLDIFSQSVSLDQIDNFLKRCVYLLLLLPADGLLDVCLYNQNIVHSLQLIDKI